MVTRISPLASRIALVIVAILVAAWMIAGWMHSNAIRSEFLTARPHLEGFPVTVHSNEAGRVVIDRTPATERGGIWGLESENAYAQISTIVRIDEGMVERGIGTLHGEIEAGDAVRIDPDAYFGDPTIAHGLGFETPRAPSDIGPHPTWLIEGRRSTWIIFVHGRGIDRLGESLRIIPSLVEQGFPVLSITYRNDVGATPSPSGLRLWGFEEWNDLDAAISLAQRRGAYDFVLIGSGYGASIVSTFLHESANISSIRGVIFDSPVLDLEGVVKRWADDAGTPGSVAWLGRGFSLLRFGMEWEMLNQFERTDEFDVRILLMFGAEDPVTPAAYFVRFAEDLPDLVETERFEQGSHGDLWNVDAQRYERAIADFLLSVIGPE